MTFLGWLDRIISLLEKAVVSSCMIIMAGILLISVICRHLHIVMVGGEEIAQFAIVWLTFWGAGLCARKGHHILMSAVLNKIPREKRKKVITGICIFTGCFCLVLFIYGTQLTYDVFRRGQVTPALRVPIWYMYIAAPCGFFLAGIYYIGAFVKNITRKETYLGLEPE